MVEDRLSIESFLSAAQQHSKVMIFARVESLGSTPLKPLEVLRAHPSLMQEATLLESRSHEKDFGRYSYLGFNPLSTLCIQNQQVILSSVSQGKNLSKMEQVQALTEDPLQVVRRFYEQEKAFMSANLAGFAGGIAGFFSYNAATLFEEKLANALPASQTPDIFFRTYQDHLMVDEVSQEHLIATLVPCHNEVGQPLEKNFLVDAYEKACARIKNFYEIFSKKQKSTVIMNQALFAKDAEEGRVHPSLNDAEYIAAAHKAKEYIVSGDSFQIVLARTFHTTCQVNPLDVYCVLRETNPSPYMFYLDLGAQGVVLGASPEKMVSVVRGCVQSCPLAGTRPRGPGYDDEAQSLSLQNDEKEVAEHMMLVDLARNDLGSVAKVGGVRVTALKQIKLFSHVMHISSTVEGTLNSQHDALDALVAALPAGTLSGAPKIRAMQIISELEGQRRGLYGGAIGYLDSRGDLNSCIAIRMGEFLPQPEGSFRVRVSAGAGIVADSILELEAQETRHKARAVLEAIRRAEEELV